MAAKEHSAPPETPDGRYIVVRGRLWRKTRPDLPPEQRATLVQQLMAARRAVKDAGSDDAVRRRARGDVDAAKQALGERGPVWWTDGAPDFNRRLARNTPYRSWYEAMQLAARQD